MANFGSMPNLFRRCVEGCEEFGSPACPACPDGQICSLIPPTCDECQKTICVAQSAVPSMISSASRPVSSGPNVGAIAGGIIGGVVVIAVFTYLVWRFCIKTKRQKFDRESWSEESEAADETEKEKKEPTLRREARASTHTLGSVASTVLTRASNIIQIAYIPGVTNRSAPSTPGLLVPPVPPIPMGLSLNDGSTSRYEQEHFFMPGDLRNSTYSTMTGITDRTSYARTSVASTIYGKNAILSLQPAQTGIRGKAAVVSVKSNAVSDNEIIPPPLPNIDYSRFTGAGAPPSPTFSVGSTFIGGASVKAVAKRSRLRETTRTPSPDQASSHHSFRDSNSRKPSIEGHCLQKEGRLSTSTLSAVIMEATKKARDGTAPRATTPFGDEHEMRDEDDEDEEYEHEDEEDDDDYDEEVKARGKKPKIFY